jgi:hypothetical protein
MVDNRVIRHVENCMLYLQALWKYQKFPGCSCILGRTGVRMTQKQFYTLPPEFEVAIMCSRRQG